MKKQLLIACMVVLCGCVNEPPKAQTAKKLNEWPGIPNPILPARDYTKPERGDEWLTDTLKKWRDFYIEGTELLQIKKSRVRVMFEIIELDTEIQEMSASMLNSGLNAWMLKEVKRREKTRNKLIDTSNELAVIEQKLDSAYNSFIETHNKW